MIIHPAQILLISVLVLFIFYIMRFRSILVDRLIFTASALAGIVFVISPDMTTRVANLIGIGRGADLILYLFVIVFLFYSASVAAWQRKLDRKMTQVVRRIALAHPQKGQDYPE